MTAAVHVALREATLMTVKTADAGGGSRVDLRTITD